MMKKRLLQTTLDNFSKSSSLAMAEDDKENQPPASLLNTKTNKALRSKTVKAKPTKKRKQSDRYDRKQLSLSAFFGQPKTNLRSKKRKKQLATLDTYQQNNQQAMISIAFRKEGGNGGKGPFFDHFCLQKNSSANTYCVASAEQNADLIREAAKEATHQLPRGIEVDGTRIPETINPEQVKDGLLYIPGQARASTKPKRIAEHEKRLAVQRGLYHKALLRGQPVLAVCAGSWFIWQEAGGQVEEVHGHCARRMPAIKQTSGKVGHNTQVHRIEYSDTSWLLRSFMQADKYANPKPAVNSIHWQAPKAATTPAMFEVSAYAVKDESIQPKNIPDTQEHTVEAFESLYGAPILGILWHPECYTKNINAAYFPTQHSNIIRLMSEAGVAYSNRCRVVEDIKIIAKEKDRWDLFVPQLRKVKKRKNSTDKTKQTQLPLSQIHQSQDKPSLKVTDPHASSAQASQQRRRASRVQSPRRYLKKQRLLVRSGQKKQLIHQMEQSGHTKNGYIKVIKPKSSSSQTDDQSYETVYQKIPAKTALIEPRHKKLMTDKKGKTLLQKRRLSKKSIFRPHEKIGPRKIENWVLKDVASNGNCFYLAATEQLYRLKHVFVAGIPDIIMAADRLRHCIQQENYKDKEWADIQEIWQLSYRLQVIVAIIDTRHPKNGFVYYCMDASHNKTHTQDIKRLPQYPIIELAYNGNHYLCVEKKPHKKNISLQIIKSIQSSSPAKEKKNKLSSNRFALYQNFELLGQDIDQMIDEVRIKMEDPQKMNETDCMEINSQIKALQIRLNQATTVFDFR